MLQTWINAINSFFKKKYFFNEPFLLLTFVETCRVEVNTVASLAARLVSFAAGLVRESAGAQSSAGERRCHSSRRRVGSHRTSDLGSACPSAPTAGRSGTRDAWIRSGKGACNPGVAAFARPADCWSIDAVAGRTAPRSSGWERHSSLRCLGWVVWQRIDASLEEPCHWMAEDSTVAATVVAMIVASSTGNNLDIVVVVVVVVVQVIIVWVVTMVLSLEVMAEALLVLFVVMLVVAFQNVVASVD